MKVLVVEDDQYHARFVQDAIAEELPEVTETVHALDGAEGEAEARDCRFDGVVMDLQMARRNGIEAARSIWVQRPDTRILFWSNYSDEAYLRGISRVVPRASAYGYVLKTASRDRLKLALRAVLLEGQIMVDREMHRLQHQTAARNALAEGDYTLLLDLALGLQDRTIAERRNMSIRTVQNRLLALYDKLGVSGEEQPALNKRVRALHNAFRDKILNAEVLESAEADFRRWRDRR